MTGTNVTSPSTSPATATAPSTPGLTAEERDARLADGADELAEGRRSLQAHPQLLLGISAGLMTTGLSIIVLGWFGAARSTLVEEQIPYLISGGLLGVALATIGALTLFAHWLTVLVREGRRQEVSRKQDHVELMEALALLTASLDPKGGRMAVLEVQNLSVQFGAHHAVRDVDLAVDGGEIVGLIGPNGAGKTTTFNAIAGVQRGTGTVHLDGVDVSSASPQRRAKLGMNRTFQRLEVFGSMTAYDNVRTSAEIASRARNQSMRSAVATADGIVDVLGLGDVTAQRADALPTGRARLVELGRALATDPKVLLLDEPASGLDDVETRRLATVLDDLRAQGLAILLVEHDIDLVMRLCSRIYVLHLGEVIAQGPPAEIRDDPHVREAYLGAEV